MLREVRFWIEASYCSPGIVIAPDFSIVGVAELNLVIFNSGID
jgi:hypothetical protein